MKMNYASKVWVAKNKPTGATKRHILPIHNNIIIKKYKN